jgi:hypothetical protein
LVRRRRRSCSAEREAALCVAEHSPSKFSRAFHVVCHDD